MRPPIYPDVRTLSPKKILEVGKEFLQKSDLGAAAYYLSFAERIGQTVCDLVSSGQYLCTTKEQAKDYFDSAKHCLELTRNSSLDDLAEMRFSDILSSNHNTEKFEELKQLYGSKYFHPAFCIDIAVHK